MVPEMLLLITTVATDASNISTSTSSSNLPFSQDEVIVVSCLLIAMTIFGITANLLTICVIAKSSKLRSVFHLFITSLCFSDLASSLISPVFHYRRTEGFHHWNIPKFFCKAAWCIHMWTNYVTSLHILCFACLRLVAIARPNKFRDIKNLHAKLAIVIIWLVTFLVGGLPLSLWFHVAEYNEARNGKPACTVSPDKLEIFQLYTRVAYPIFFYIPIIAVTAVSCAIFQQFIKRNKKKTTNSQDRTRQREVSFDTKSLPLKTLSGETDVSSHKIRKPKKTKAKEKTASLQLFLIVGSFLLGYLPFTIYQLLSYVRYPDESDASHRFDWRFGIAEYICLRFSECLNPVFYNVASRTMWEETKMFLKNIFCCSRIRRGRQA